MSSTMIPRLTLSLLAATVAITLAVPPAFSDTLVIPAALENVEGNLSNTGPFGKLTPLNNDPFRTQQVYGAMAFPEGSEGVTIEELRFRPDFSFGEMGPITANQIEISLSTTSKMVDGLDSTDLNLNVGPDVTVVYSGSLTLSSCDCGTPTRNFDVVVTLQEAFYYQPDMGNLLVDVVNTSSPYPVGFLLDAEDSSTGGGGPDETSRLVEVIIPGTGAHEIVGANVSTGLVTQFVYTVPEPSGAAVGLAAILGLATWKRAVRS
jgi:hypothetical protein